MEILVRLSIKKGGLYPNNLDIDLLEENSDGKYSDTDY